ncbi:uncharacterized protein V2V93DRAFT_365300 [Kockiozyma suomiensis]|uniref:uncharacterized protein n=1 Tax=Kockiozyma suomiensis TaxID=1337062 RepID=UPI0033432689
MAKKPLHSGILPRPRRILEFPKPVSKNPDQGYAENVPNPRGTSRYQLLKPFPDLDNIFTKTISEPKSARPENYKNKMAELRRRYLRESLAKEYQRHMENLRKQAAEAQKQIERAEFERQDLAQMQQDKIFTLPTVASYIKTYHPPSSSTVDEEAKKLLTKSAKYKFLADKLKRREEHVYNLWSQEKNFATTAEDVRALVDKGFTDQRETRSNQYDRRNINFLVYQSMKKEMARSRGNTAKEAD